MFSFCLPLNQKKENKKFNLEQTDEEPSLIPNILFNKTRLSDLLKAVCQCIVDSVHTKALHMK